MNAMHILVFVNLVGFPYAVVGQEAGALVRRELFDPLDRNRATPPGIPAGVTAGLASDIRCGTRSSPVSSATLAEAAARTAKFRATGLRGYIEAEAVQPDEDTGIEFLVEFVNEGSDPIELSDVTNALNIILFRNTAPAGHVIPSWTFHRAGPPKYTTAFPDEAEVRAEARAAKKEAEKGRPYTIVEPGLRGPKVRTLRDIRETGDVRLNPGEHFQMAVRITEGLADPAEYWWNLAEMSKTSNVSRQRPDPSDIDPLPAGQYSLSLWLDVSVSIPHPDETAPVRQHAILFCDAIKIHLANVPEAGGD